MRSEHNHVNSPQAAAATLKLAVHFSPVQHTGGTMQITRTAAREMMRDFLLVSSFGFWALLLGFLPVAAIHALIA